MSGKDYRAYLLSKNKLDLNNQNTYKAKYETAIGKITPEEAEQQLELNDNLIDEEQIHNELRDLLRKYIPNLQYLDKALTNDKLTDQMKYDLLLNFGTYVEPKVNAIRNRKLSVERFVAFLVQLGKELAQAGLTQDINEKITKLTNVFRPQINDYEADEAGKSQEDLVNQLVAMNLEELNALGITENSVDGLKVAQIINLIKQLMFVDKLAFNYERARNKANSGSSVLFSEEDINKKSITGTKYDLANFFVRYLERITNPELYAEVPFKQLLQAYETRMKFYENTQRGSQQQEQEPELDEEQKLNVKAKLDKDFKPQSIMRSLPPNLPSDLTYVNYAIETFGDRGGPKYLQKMRDEKYELRDKAVVLLKYLEEEKKKVERMANALKREISKLESSKTNLSKKDKRERAYLKKQLVEAENEINYYENEIKLYTQRLESLQPNLRANEDIDRGKERQEEYLMSQNDNKQKRIPKPNINFEEEGNLDGENDDLFGEYSGYGLRKKKSTSQYEQQLVGGKYFINRKKLSANVLEIRYTKNRHLIPIKSQIVGKSLRTIIEEIIDSNNLDKQKYEKLTKIEQNLLRSLLPYLGRDIDDVDDDEAFYDRFDVIRGELLSGNDNKMLKREAKQYLMHALNTGKISRTHFNQMLIDLDL